MSFRSGRRRQNADLNGWRKPLAWSEMNQVKWWAKGGYAAESCSFLTPLLGNNCKHTKRVAETKLLLSRPRVCDINYI